MKKLGCHVSFKGPKYLVGAAEEAISYGAKSMMIYLGAPQNTRRVAKEKMLLEEYKINYQNLIPQENILVHAPYIVNPASVEKHPFAISFLIQEIKIMNFLGIKKMVLHPGAHTKFTRKQALETLIQSLKKILGATENVEILLETMSGKGTEIGTNLEELVYLIEQVNSPRLGVCADTCHLWEAGYDLNNVDKFFQVLKKSSIFSHIKAWHINNSKKQRGEHKDRHEQILKGQIKPSSLKQIVNSVETRNVIQILETPWENDQPPYKAEIQWLNS